MRTIQQCNLTLMIWLLTLCNKNMEAHLFCWEFFSKFFASHILSLLYNPKMERFSLNNKIILITYLFLNSSYFLTWETRNDTVYKSCTNIAIFCKPVFECFIIFTKIILP